MRMNNRVLLFVAVMLQWTCLPAAAQGVDSLLAHMTLAEKLGQLNLISANTRATPQQLDVERRRFLRAPLVVAVVSCVRDHTKIREWDQVLSAGACCLNILNAAHALGFGAQWLTECYAYDIRLCRRFGLVEKERIAGFIHMGSPAERPADRPRPAVADLLRDWKPDRAPE